MVNLFLLTEGVCMDVFNVFLDSNVFINEKYNFSGTSSLSNLKKYIDDGMVNLYTNDIVVREVKHHIKKDIRNLSAQAKNAVYKCKELMNALPSSEAEFIKNAIMKTSERLLEAFDSYIKNSADIDYSNTSLEELFSDYFNSEAPFEGRKEKKSEFPDAVIVKSIKQYWSDSEEKLYIITDDNGWNNALKNEKNIIVLKNLKLFLSEVSKKQKLYEKMLNIIKENEEYLKNEVKKMFLEREWELIIDDLYTNIECNEITDILCDKADICLKFDAVEHIDDDGGVIAGSGYAKTTISFECIDHSEEQYDREDHVWYNTKYADGEIELQVPFDLFVDVFIDEDKESVEINSVSIESHDDKITVIEFNTNEHYEEEEENKCFYDICPDCGCKINLENDGGNGFCTECAFKH